MSRSQTQFELLRGEWRFLLVMDAARPDYVRQLDPQFREVEALGGITHVWCHNLWGLVPGVMTYFSANPVTSWKRRKVGAEHVRMIEVWRDEWKKFGRWKVGSVHPADLNACVLAWLAEHRPPRRVVVHYLQPHAPYIAFDLPVRCGNLMDGPTGKQRDVDVRDAIERKLMTWDDLRTAYMGNLRLVLAAAKDLVPHLRHQGEVVITSDHGELLGEGGRYGHAGVPFDSIRHVPYWSSKWEERR